MKNRVWELDALRGICILGVIIVHFVYDITELYALVQLDLPEQQQAQASVVGLQQDWLLLEKLELQHLQLLQLRLLALVNQP